MRNDIFEILKSFRNSELIEIKDLILTLILRKLIKEYLKLFNITAG